MRKCLLDCQSLSRIAVEKPVQKRHSLLVVGHVGLHKRVQGILFLDAAAANRSRLVDVPLAVVGHPLHLGPVAQIRHPESRKNLGGEALVGVLPVAAWIKSKRTGAVRASFPRPQFGKHAANPTAASGIG